MQKGDNVESVNSFVSKTASRKEKKNLCVCASKEKERKNPMVVILNGHHHHHSMFRAGGRLLCIQSQVRVSE